VHVHTLAVALFVDALTVLLRVHIWAGRCCVSHTGHITWQNQTCLTRAGLLLLLGVSVVSLSRALFGVSCGCKRMPVLFLYGATVGCLETHILKSCCICMCTGGCPLHRPPFCVHAALPQQQPSTHAGLWALRVGVIGVWVSVHM
jgi:hypothetical protein